MSELMVATYNTRKESLGWDPTLDSVLHGGNELVCLQEVSPARAARVLSDFGTRSFVSLAKHGLQYLATVLPEDARFLSRRTFQLNGHLGLLPAAWSVRYGCALHRAGRPGWTDALEPRVAQVACISWRGVEFQLINTHLPFVAGLRNKCLVRLQELPRHRSSLVVGDLNATPDDLFLNDLVLAGGFSFAGKGGATHVSGRRIDYVMYGGGFREAGYSLERGLSDHRLVRTTLEV